MFGFTLYVVSRFQVSILPAQYGGAVLAVHHAECLGSDWQVGLFRHGDVDRRRACCPVAIINGVGEAGWPMNPASGVYSI